jgi:deoxyribodipyrimidine photo-lyase
MQKVNIMWFRRDLRLHDNAALYHALKNAEFPVLPIFVFDTHILDKLENKTDARVQFIHQTLQELNTELHKLGTSIKVYNCTPLQAFEQLCQSYQIHTVYTNHDYEQYAQNRDAEIQNYLLTKHNTELKTYKDHVIFEKNEVLKDDGKPYTVFTPYANKWKKNLTDYQLKSYPTQSYQHNYLHTPAPYVLPTLQSMGFSTVNIQYPPKTTPPQIIQNYTQNRNFPALKSTSQLGLHLRFGTISIRKLATAARTLNQTFFNEIIWRDFYHTITYHFPHICSGQSFKKEYNQIQWINNPAHFAQWCSGHTGYPIVDAGMRELNHTGFMHNRVRMIVASFLTKHLLIDWRWGEAYFAQKLLDFDFAANNGGWQWAAGSGCDAAPYFRVFNPQLQTEKFDAQHQYIKKWVPEYQTATYPAPIVDHKTARDLCLKVYAQALKK